MRATHVRQPAPYEWHEDGPALQDHTYRHDLVGNLAVLADRTPGCGVPPGDPDALDRHFSYDPHYRLVDATGRETDLTPSPPWLDTPRGQDLTSARRYQESYSYDPAGGLVTLQHATDASSQGAFTRTYSTAADSNRVTSVTSGGVAYAYGYDASGNLTTETTSRHLEWDREGNVATFRTQPEGAAEPSLYTQYRYDPDGMRVVKVTRRQGGAATLTVYVGGAFERRVIGVDTPTSSSTHDLVHVLDLEHRVATLRRGPPLPDDPSPDSVYVLADHLGSSSVTLDDHGVVLSREEYTPTERRRSAVCAPSATASTARSATRRAGCTTSAPATTRSGWAGGCLPTPGFVGQPQPVRLRPQQPPQPPRSWRRSRVHPGTLTRIRTGMVGAPGPGGKERPCGDLDTPQRSSAC